MSSRCGRGNYTFTEAEAKAEIERLTKEFQLATYWYEADKPAPLNLKGHRCSYGDLTFIAAKSPEASPS